MQRAPEGDQQTHQRPTEGPKRWAKVNRAAGGAKPEKDVPEVPQQTQLQADEAGERVRGAGVPGKGAHQIGLHRWVRKTETEARLESFYANFTHGVYLYVCVRERERPGNSQPNCWFLS